MPRIRVLLSVLTLSAVAFAQTAQTPPSPKPKAHGVTAGPQGFATGWQAIHNSALVIDTHADTPGRFVDENFDLAQDAGHGYMDFNKIKAGNLGAEFFSIWVNPTEFKGKEIKRALDMIDSVYEQARLHPDKMMMAYSTQDILAAHRQHKLAALMGVEGGHAIQGDIRVLRDYYRLGVRYMTLTWSNTNELGDSSGDLDRQKHPAPQRHHAVWTPGGARDEPHGHDGGHLARRGPHVLPGTGVQPRTRHRLALVVARDHQCPAQHDRRHAGRARPQWRRRAGELLLRIHLAEVGRRHEEAQRRERSRL